MDRRHVLVLALLAGVVLAGCATPEAYREWYQRQEDAGPEGVTVHLDNNRFVDQRITVAVNTTVTWVNNDTIRHTVTFENLTFDRDVDGPKESVSYTFDRPGTFDYRCKPHSTGYRNWDQMVGRVTVVEG